MPVLIFTKFSTKTNYDQLVVFRLIKHTKQLLEENEEKLCIKVLQTLREMMTKDRGYGEKVLNLQFIISLLFNTVFRIQREKIRY